MLGVLAGRLQAVHRLARPPLGDQGRGESGVERHQQLAVGCRRQPLLLHEPHLQVAGLQPHRLPADRQLHEALSLELGRQGVAVGPENLRVAENVTLILPLHRELDALRESSSAVTAIGTTRRGIGPAYEDKVGRRAIRLMDLADLDTLPHKIDRLLAHHNALRRGLRLEEIDARTILKELTAFAPQLLPYAETVWRLLDIKRREGKRILFEGAQGALLDVDHGTYPFVTSSNTTAGGAATGSGVGPRNFDYVLGIIKAYATRVGGGPFPTELNNETGEHLRKKGDEYGTVTRRPRRCGWFDAVAARRSIFLNSMSGLVVTKLDVMDELPVVRICTGYKVAGKPCDTVPIGAEGLARVEPVYEDLPGWQSSTVGVTQYDELPEKARKYLKRLEEVSGAEVAIVSTGPDREHTIVLRNPFD